MSSTALVLDKKNGIGKITLKRPNYNALNLELANDLIQALENCCEDDSVKVLIITGDGHSFCSGHARRRDKHYSSNRPRLTCTSNRMLTQ